MSNPEVDEYVNSCAIGPHKVRGMCAEIANMVNAESLIQQGNMVTNSRVTWAIYGMLMASVGDKKQTRAN